MSNKSRTLIQSRVLIFIAVLSSILIRIYFIYLRHYPAGDEIWGYFLAKTDLRSIWLGTLGDVHAPLYFIFLHSLELLLPFKIDIFFVRLLSLFFAIIASFAIWKLASLVLGKKVGIIAFYLSLFSPGMVWVAVYGRYYSLLILLTTFSVILFIKYLNKNSWKTLVILMGIILIGTYTHYYFVLILLTCLIFIAVSKNYRFLLKRFLLMTFGVIVFCSPLAYFFMVLPKPDLVGRGYNILLKIPAVLISNLTSYESFIYLFYHGEWKIYSPVLITLWCSTLFLLFSVLIAWKSKFKELFFGLLIIPPLILVLFSFFSSFMVAVGSLSIFTPPVLLLLAKSFDSKLKYVNAIKVIFTVSLIFTFVFFWQSSNIYAVPRQDMVYISRNLQAGDVFINGHFYAFLLSKYYFGDHAVFGINDKKTASVFSKDAVFYKPVQASEIINFRTRVWYLEPYFGSLLEAIEVKKTLDENFVLLEKFSIMPEVQFKENFEYFNVYLYSPK